MKKIRLARMFVLFVSTLFCMAAITVAQDEGGTEITGFYQQYRDFGFKTGAAGIEIPASKLTGGGFSLAQNLAPWFAIWTQFTFYGKTGENIGLPLRIINNSQGPRWQKNYGPLRLYVKGGVGFSHYSFENIGSNTKLSLTYGGGAQVWLADWLGVTLDLSQVLMGVPNLTDLEGRDKWDSGLTLTPGITLRF